MKKLLPFVFVVAIAAVGLAALSWRRHHEEALLAGTVEARDVRVGSLVGGRVVAVHAEEGALVRAGDPLVTLEPDLLDLQLREQQAHIDEAESRLLALRPGPRTEEIERARIEHDEASREAARYRKLLEQGVVSREAAEQRDAIAATKRQQLEQLRRGTRAEDIAAQEAAVAQERERLAYLQRQQRETIVRVPVDARVQSLDLRPGDLVAANQPVAELVEESQTLVRLFVPETRLGEVRVGQHVALKVDTFPDREFTGRVASIRERSEYTPRNVQTFSQRSEQVFGVRVDIDAPELQPGMAVTARLLPQDAASP